ncbi:MAG: sporulation integral membrane protein YtvI [Ectobacillus sp.]
MWKKWILLGLLLLAAIWLIPYSLPIIFALLTAILLDGAVARLQRKAHFQRVYAVTVVFLSYIATLGVLIYFMINTIFKQSVALAQKTPNFVKELYATTILPIIQKWRIYSETLPGEVLSSIERALENAVNSLDMLAQNIIQMMLGVITVVPGMLLEILIYLIALFLISLELPRLKAKAEHYLTESTKQKLELVVSQLSNAGIGFIKAQVFLSFLTFIMAYTGLWLLHIPYTALLSLLIVIVDVLPILGTGSVLVPWAVLSILQGHQSLGIGLIVLFLVITVVRRIVEPKVYSKSMGISALAALVSLYIGFKVLGFAGLFLGPALVIVYDTLQKSGVIRIRFKI